MMLDCMLKGLGIGLYGLGYFCGFAFRTGAAFAKAVIL